MSVIAALKSFGQFWYDFIVGDDWRVALGVAVALAATWGLTRSGVNAWWLLPVAVAGLLGLSLARVVRAARQK
ncbi:hypothetical protein [Streptacidiphilus fuscans]|uniref:Uncharacterized protein n=1 Tax=Streptacidiphilus fuscans TaxID=2789292 RepID=A0A931BCK1_9ACTN|nr:hypothetical protein [Streptacidiphilus fuscans]MBF9073732.1 hypothetical protein [Streptacidiphilus fuscans]